MQNAQGAYLLLKDKSVWRQKTIQHPREEEEYLDIKRQIANLKGSFKVRYQQLEELSDLEMERKKWLEHVKPNWIKKEKLFNLLFQTLEEARKQVEENIAPRLKPYVSKWISRITKVVIRNAIFCRIKDLHLSFFEPKTGKSIPVSHLSRGTMDQMYFALRFAIIQFYSEQRNGTFLPLFLDDSFAHFDDTRLRAIMKILHHFSKKHQIFLCTCQDRERRVLEKKEFHFSLYQLSRLGYMYS